MSAIMQSKPTGELVPTGRPLTGTEADNAQFLTFTLDGETYGVDILRVREIKGWTPVTRVPNTPQYVRGVLNLRGTIVPIVDMRMRFNLEQVEYSAVTVIIVLSVMTVAGERVIGIVVDGVSDVLDVTPQDIKPAPDFGTRIRTEFINGLATVGELMVMLLDVDKLLTETELSEMETVNETGNG